MGKHVIENDLTSGTVHHRAVVGNHREGIVAKGDPVFAIECEKCHHRLHLTLTETHEMKVRPGVYAFHCQVCDHDVEYSPVGKPTRKPSKHKKEVKA